MHSFDETQAKQFLAECRRTGQTILHLALETGLRPGEYCALSWADINLEACSLKVERSVRFGFRGGGWQVAPPKTESGRRTVRFSLQLRDALVEHRTRQRKWIATLRRRVKSPVLLKGKGVNYQKRKRMRVISRETLANIAKYDLVFPSETGVYQSPNNLNRREFRRALTAIGLSPKIYTLYSLRHSAATLSLASGADIKTVARKLGHKNVTLILETYGHVLDSMKEDALHRLSEVLYD